MARVVWLVGGGGRNVDKFIAHLPEVKAELRLNAYKGGAKAKAILARHKPSGGPSPHSRITVTKGNKLDWFVNLDDPDGAAMSIEFGRSGGPGGVATQGVHAITGAF